MYYEAMRMEIWEGSSQRPIRDSLLVIKVVDPVYSSIQRDGFTTIEYQNRSRAIPIPQRTMEEETESFDKQNRENQTIAICTSLATEAKPSFKGKDPEGKEIKDKDQKGTPNLHLRRKNVVCTLRLPRS